MKMTKLLLTGMAAAAAILAGSNSASAATYLVKGVFDDGTHFSGTFDVNSYGYLESANITTVAGTLPGFDYVWVHGDRSGSNNYASNGQNYVAFSPGYFGDFNLQFQSDLAGGPDPIVGGTPGLSFECADSWGCPDAGEIRYVASGFATPVPEPATWAMLLLGFGGLGAAMRNQRRKLALTTL